MYRSSSTKRSAQLQDQITVLYEHIKLSKEKISFAQNGKEYISSEQQQYAVLTTTHHRFVLAQPASAAHPATAPALAPDKARSTCPAHSPNARMSPHNLSNIVSIQTSHVVVNDTATADVEHPHQHQTLVITERNIRQNIRIKLICCS